MFHCNKNNNVEQFIQNNKKYIFHLPETNTLLNVICKNKAIRAADIQIINMMQNGEKITNFDNHYFSYNYENFDKIYFTSYAYYEKCNIYCIDNISYLHGNGIPDNMSDDILKCILMHP